MPATMKELGLEKLNAAERIALAQELWDSVPDIPDAIPLTNEQRETLDRRLADLDANPNNVLTWEEIKARVRGQA